MRSLFIFCALLISFPTWAAHAYSQFGDIKYASDFKSFGYVNPHAEKGGELVLVSPGATGFDKFNPFILKGRSAPGITGLVFESLLTSSMDEPATAYGLLAEDVSVASDHRSVVFRLRPQARFSDGAPVLADDVKASFDKLMSPQAAPQFKTFYAEVAAVRVLDARTVRFDFKSANPELPLVVGAMPVMSSRWGMVDGQAKPFDQVVTDLPIGSGPYTVGHVVFGRDISYERNPDYWGSNINVRRGMFNFDRITYRLYKDSTAQLEGFKAGEFDLIQCYVAREWARSYSGRLFNNGQLIKRELKHSNAADFQAFAMNTRRDKFKDVRVREAITLAMDFEWMNRQLFYNAYQRVNSYFSGTEFAAKELPDIDELGLLLPLRDKLSPKVLSQPVPEPVMTLIDPQSGQTLRDHLRKARDLLAQAGWTYRNGALRNDKGEPFVIEFLDGSGTLQRVVTAYSKSLQKLGITLDYRVMDQALFQKRVDAFDYDMITVGFVGSRTPGTELMERFSSKTVNVTGSDNAMGIHDPAVDALLERVLAARTRPQLISAVKSLDRVLRFGYYTVPHWYSGVHRVAWRRGRFEQPVVMPLYYQPEAWATMTWWGAAANRQVLISPTERP